MAIQCPRCDLENGDQTPACAGCGTPLQSSNTPAGAAAETVVAALSAAPETVVPAVSSRDSQARATGGTLALGEALQEGGNLGPRYQIVRLLGRGGMGAVYLARDRELGRDVAVKVIAPQFVESADFIERFKREIRLSSVVTHPNVLRVYDLSEADGIKFLTMQFVPGRSLDAVLRDEKPLPLERAVALFRQVCEGLAAAHEQGVTHRDLKPQNVMVDEADRVFLMDFGLATSQFVTAMTQTGGVFGTPHYMSPEQVRGEHVDARSDVFSLGVMLYEMLAGALPYSGDSLFEVMIRRTHSAPPPASSLNPAIPPYLLGVIDKCLAIEKEQRYGSVREIVADLDSGTVRVPVVAPAPPRPARKRWPWVAAAAALVLVSILGGTWAYLGRPRGAAGSKGSEAAVAAPLVGVVPFANRTGDASLEWAGEGIARLVADSLALSRHVRVLSPQRAAALRSGAKDDAAFLKASLENDVAYVVSGEILASGSGFTVATRVTDTRNGTDVGSTRVDGASKSDVIAASNGVAAAVRRGLRIPLTEQVDTFNADFATQKIDAYEIYVQGLNAVSAYKYDDAVRLFKAALEKAPDFTMARFRLANAYGSMGETDAAVKEIAAALAEASRLPDREARYVRALDAFINRRFDEAVTLYKELVDRYPYDLEPRQFLTHVYEAQAKWPEVVEQATAMIQIDPRSHSSHAMLGLAHLNLKEYNKAIENFRTYSRLEPGSANAHHLLADAYRAQGVADLAATEYRKALEVDPGFHFSTVALAQVEAVRGQYAEAERLLAPLAADGAANASRRVDAAVDLASIRRAQGRFAEAIEVLERAQAPIKAEKVREAMTLAVQALSYLELGDAARAERVAREALSKSPGVPTRYLFAVAQVQLAQGKLAAARTTAAEILKGALPADNPDRTEDKAAAYIRGLALMKEGKPQEAREELTRAVALSGYEYSVYRLGLARAHLQLNALADALAGAKQASAASADPLDPRLDLDLDRVRAGLIEAEVHAAMGRLADAAERARKFLEAWSRAAPGLPDLIVARRLAGER